MVHDLNPNNFQINGIYIFFLLLQKSYCLGVFGHFLQNEIFGQKSSSFSFFTIKGYLRHKMITSQNVASEAQVKIFFVSQKSYAPS